MNILKALRLSLSNVKLLIVALLSQILTFSVTICLFTLLMQASVTSIIVELQLDVFGDIFTEIVNEIANPEFSAVALGVHLDSLIATISDLASKITNINLKLTIAFVLLIIGVIVGKFFIGVNDIPTMAGFSQYMDNNARTPYAITYVKSFKKSLLFQLQYLLFTFGIDVILIFGLLFILAILLLPFGVVGIIIMFISAILVYSARLTMFAWWMPCLVSEKHSVATSLRLSLKAIWDDFFSVMIQTAVVISTGAVITILVMYLGGIIAGLITAGVIIIVFNFILRALYIISYYERMNKPYYVSKLDVGIKKVY